MWLMLLVAFASIWFAWTKWKLSYWSRKGVPHPEPNLLFGNIGPTLTFKEHMGSLSMKWYNEYKDAPYVGYYKFTTPAIVLRDPDLIKDALIKDFNSFAGNDFHIDGKYDPLFNISPFFCKDETWKRGRNMLVPVFSQAKIKAIYPSMEYASEKLIKYIKEQSPGKDFDAKSICAKFATENTIKCSFSLNADCFESKKSEFRDIGKCLLQPSAMSALKFLLIPILPKWLVSFIPIPMLPRQVDTWFRELIAQNRASRKTENGQREDFMQALLNVGEKLNANDLELASHSLVFFLEGFETSSTVMSFALYELGRNQEVQQRVYEEIKGVSARHDNKFTYEALQDMTYLECVIHESQRLNPVILQMPKLCTAEYTLPKFGNQKEGVQIDPGTTVIIPTRAIHLDPELYPNPEVFIPERFTEEERKKRPKSHYLPFGEGPRMCMGMRFGHIQVKAGVMTIVRDFKITLSPKQKPIVADPQSLLWQAKDGLFLNFEPRQ